MAKFIKDLSTASSHILGATVSVASNGAKVIESLANSATTFVDGTSKSTQNLMVVSTNATAEWADNAELSYEQNKIANASKLKATKKVASNEAFQKKIEDAEEARLMAEIMEDYDLTPLV